MTPERWRVITEIFHAARARDAAARDRIVAARCGGDVALRRDVESMLAAHEQAGRFGETPVFAAGAIDSGSSPAAPCLTTGRHVGPYRIVALLGAGGMGEVYRARDTRLERDVALKVLPAAVASDPDRLARFAREARVLASLNHPNIAQVHGLEEAEGVCALVLELIEGHTLADKVARGPIPLEEALGIARQIAEALEAAHEQRVIHRDLKPANIMLRPDGTVKVLDFGLAKLVAAQAGSDRSRAATAESRPGALVGTLSYMSPEQARGIPVDRRADLWAFGCVLFEMLTARRAFAGETPSDTLAQVIEHDPDWPRLPGKTPPALRKLLKRCCERDPRQRLDSAAVVRIELDEVAREPTPLAHEAGGRRRSMGRSMGWAAAGAAVAVLATLMIMGQPRPSEQPGTVVAASVSIDRMISLGQPGVHFAVAPSGGTVVLAGDYGGVRVLKRRNLDQLDPEPIVGTEGGSDVFFSPDARWLGFETRSELWTMPLDGSSPRRLLSNQPLRGGSWGEGGQIVFGRVGSGLWMTSTAGGNARPLTTPEPAERHELPVLLPGGRAVLFTILATDKPPQIAAHLLATGETRLLVEGVGARYVPSGHVVFGRQGRLWAMAFDVDTLQTRGAARPVRDDVLWSAAGYPQFDVNGGLLAYVRTKPGASKWPAATRLSLVDRHGNAQILPLDANNFLLARLSPGGDKLAVQVGASRDLWTYDVGRGTFARLTSDRIVAFSAPGWTPDGSRVFFTTWFDGEVGLGWLPADGSGPVEALVKDVGMRSFERTNPVMLPDSSAVILTGLAPGATEEDLLIVRLTGKRRLEPLFRARGVERNPAISPSGRFIAYNSDESGRPQVYVRPLPNADSRKWQVSIDGGAGPAWIRGGHEIVYGSQDRMMSVTVRGADTDAPEFSKPVPLFQARAGSDGAGFGLNRGWDVTPDGQRFLFGHHPTADSETPLELVLIRNWAGELQRLSTRGR